MSCLQTNVGSKPMQRVRLSGQTADWRMEASGENPCSREKATKALFVVCPAVMSKGIKYVKSSRRLLWCESNLTHKIPQERFLRNNETRDNDTRNFDFVREHYFERHAVTPLVATLSHRKSESRTDQPWITIFALMQLLLETANFFLDRNPSGKLCRAILFY